MFYRARHQLRELRRMELTVRTDHDLALLRAEVKGEADEQAKAMMLAEADANHEAALAQYNERRDQLGSQLRKLTAGYEMRTFWFELFECARKILLVGVPVFLPQGSSGQLICGLIICFMTYGMQASFAPYANFHDDLLSQMCQISIFFSLLSSIVTNAYPDDPIMSTLLPVFLIVPPVIALIFESPLLDEMDKCKEPRADGSRPRVAATVVSMRAALVRCLDRTLRTPPSHEQQRAATARRVIEALTMQMSRAVDLLRCFDADCSGTVSKEEFLRVLPALGVSVGDSSAAVDVSVASDVFDAIDVDGSGTLTFAELQRLRGVRPDAFAEPMAAPAKLTVGEAQALPRAGSVISRAEAARAECRAESAEMVAERDNSVSRAEMKERPGRQTKEDLAAVKIQAALRGRRARAELEHTRDARRARLDELRRARLAGTADGTKVADAREKEKSGLDDLSDRVKHLFMQGGKEEPNSHLSA
jgi:hypothetical protein